MIKILSAFILLMFLPFGLRGDWEEPTRLKAQQIATVLPMYNGMVLTFDCDGEAVCHATQEGITVVCE